MYPDTDVQVAGGGSGVGQGKILADLIDVGMSSSVPNASVYANCDVWSVALDAVCIVVANTSEMSFINTITPAQLKWLYQRENQINSTYWDDVDLQDGVNDGWPHSLAVPRARIIGSGTRASFNAMVLGSDSESNPNVIKEINTIANTSLARLPGNPEMVTAISGNNYHIGYVGLGFSTDPGLKVVAINGVMPTEANIRAATYPLGRSLYMMTLKPHLDPTYNLRALDWVNFIMSPAGQAHVAAEGFLTIPASQPYWDLDASHQCNILDVSLVGTPGVWLTSGTPGWRAEDVDDSGQVNILDVSVLGTHWLWNW
jgi:ABC-type phosphate transport system substrate-binding protein